MTRDEFELDPGPLEQVRHFFGALHHAETWEFLCGIENGFCRFDVERWQDCLEQLQAVHREPFGQVDTLKGSSI